MSTERTWETSSTSSDVTENLGEQLGRRLKGQEVINLVSDLGGGKTTFVRGLVKGAGSKDVVASPTFTVSKLYTTGDLEIHHFDFYRLSEAGMAGLEMQDALQDPQSVVVVEWGDVASHLLPAEQLTVTITKQGDNKRRFVYTYPPSLTYLVTDADTDN